MRGAGQADEFTELETFSLGGGAAVAADDGRVLLGTSGGRLEIRGADGERETLDIGGGVEDIAIDGYVFAVADGDVTAYTTSGIELWSTDVTAPQRIVPVGREGVLACVTEDGHVVGIDTETGSRLYSVERPHGDVTADSTVVGGHGRVVVASWSFLVAFDAAGGLLFDRNIEGAIEDVASLADSVVVRLKNGQLLRLDESGDRQWSQATEASAITPYTDDEILSIDGDGVSVIDEHGNRRPLSVPAAESVLATDDGRLVVTTANRNQSVYRKGQPAEAELAATVETDTVGSGDRIRVRVDNDGDEAVDSSATLSVDPVDAIRVRRTDATLSVPDGGSTELEFHVTEAVQAGDVCLELRVDGSAIGSGTVSVERQRDLSEAVDLSATVDAVEASGTTVSVTATNTAATPVSVGAASADHAVEPDDTATFETTVAREAGTLSVTVSGDGETVELPVEIDLDGETTLSVEAAGSRSTPYVDVVTGNGFDTTLTGTLSVAIEDGYLTLDRPVTLEPATTLRLAVLLSDDVVAGGVDVTASLEGITETTATLPESTWGRNGDAEPSRAVDTEPPASVESQSAAPALDVDRTTPDAVRRGEEFPERIEIHNTGTAAATGVEVSVGDVAYSLGELAPAATVELVRSHAVFETGPFSLPAGRVTAAAASVDIPERTVNVESPDIELTVHTTGENGRTTLNYRVDNQTPEPCRLRALGVKSPEMASKGWELDSETVGSGESATLERTVQHDGAPPATLVTGCQYQFPGSDRETYWTLPQESPDEESENEEPVSVDVDPGSVPLAGRNSAIDCTVTFGESLSEVTIEATGEMVSPLFVGEREVGDVGADESVTQAVDILPEDAGTAAFDLTITAATTDRTVEQQYTVTGPVAATESESVSASWEAQQSSATEEGSTADGTSAPAHLVTTFQT